MTQKMKKATHIYGTLLSDKTPKMKYKTKPNQWLQK